MVSGRDLNSVNDQQISSERSSPDRTPNQLLENMNWQPQVAFDNLRKRFPEFAARTSWLGFWDHVYPLQSQLTVSYVLDAFASLDCDLPVIYYGSQIASIPVAPQHGRLKDALYDIYSMYAGVIGYTGEGQYV